MIEPMAEHPSREELEAYAQGWLPPESSLELEEHLAGCVGCCVLLETAPADSFLGRLVAAGEPDGGARADSARHPEAPSIPPELIDHPRYRVLGLIGQGGMGAVYRAEHRRMERQVALKVINPGLLRHPSAAERFQQEVRAAARLHHAHIVTAFDADQAGELHFLVMEYVEGTSLAELVRQRGPLPVAEACACVRQAALGLQHAYECGMVHRDVKPHNLMLTADGRVKILDFGLALLARTAEVGPPDGAPTGPLTGAGKVLGTADYIAPEQAADARSADIRADIYALGCTLFHLLAGRPPFPGGSVREKLARQADTPLPALTALRPEVPPGLADLVARMTAKAPADRPANPAQVAEALAIYSAAGEASPSRKRRWLAAAALGLLAAGLLAGAVLVRPQPDHAEDVQTEVLPPPAGPRKVPARPNGSLPADLGEEKAIQVIRKLRGRIERSRIAAGKPIVGVHLLRTRVTDADLPVLAAFVKLETLELSFTRVTDAGMPHVGRLQRLRSLYLRSAVVGDAGIDHLAGLVRLTGLSLGESRVSNASMVTVGRLKQLRWLRLEGTLVGDAGAEHLAGLKQLASLNLSSTLITDRALATVGRLKGLKVLSLDDTAITDEGLEHLTGLVGLAKLDLRKVRGVSDAGMKSMARLKQLGSLNLFGTRVTGQGLKELAGLAGLVSLNVGGLKKVNASLGAFAGLTGLRILDLSSTDVTNEGLREVARHARLEDLNLRGATRITDAGLRELVGMPELKFLKLSGTSISDAGIKELVGCPALTFLDLKGANKVTAAGVAELRKARPAMRILY